MRAMICMSCGMTNLRLGDGSVAYCNACRAVTVHYAPRLVA